ncbi:MAG: hypothetical protein ACKOSS_07300 [Planctomycetia bacterium]
MHRSLPRAAGHIPCPRRRAAGVLAALLVLLPAGAAARTAGAGEPSPARPAPQGAALLPADATPTERATLAWLEHLGWRFVADPSLPKVAVFPGRVGERASIAEAQAQGDLLARVPPTPAGAAELRSMLPLFTDGSATRLAWQHRVEEAGKVATDKLTALTKAKRWKFPPFLFWNTPFFQFHPPPEAWAVEKGVYHASGSASQAIESIYLRGGLAECYTAQWIASYALQYELFGREAFDEVLPGTDMVVGKPEDLKPTALGQLMLSDRTYPYRALFLRPADLATDAGLFLARLGPKAFAGITGIVRAHDKGNDCNQNLTHVSMTPRACALLRERGGLPWVSEAGKQLHALIRSRAPEAKAQKAALLADPVLAEWLVYVHPFGTVSLGWMLDYEIGDEGKSAYVMLYLHAREDHFYQRYREAFERRWLAGKGIGPDRRTQLLTIPDYRTR